MMASMKPAMLVILLAMGVLLVIGPHFAVAEEGGRGYDYGQRRRPPPPPPRSRRPPPPPPHTYGPRRRPPPPPPVKPPPPPPVQPPVRPPVQPPVRPPVQPPVRPPVQPPVLPPVQPPVRPPVQPPVLPPVQPPVLPPVQPPPPPPVQPPPPPPVVVTPAPGPSVVSSPETTPPPAEPPTTKPNCTEAGGMCGDPKIVGGDGVVFYFHGRKNQDFCLVSDSDLHINAHFIGKRPAGRLRDFTWVQALGFVFGPHTLTIATKRVAKWDKAVDQIELSYNGSPFVIQGGSWASPGGVMSLHRIGETNAVDLSIKEKMGVALTIVPIGKKESDKHDYGITDDDCFAHFDMQFRFYNLSSSVNGVLGQTYQPNYVNPTKKGVAMPIMGGADRFFSSSLLATDCKSSQYTARAIADGSAMPSFSANCGSTTGLVSGTPTGLICRR